MGIMGSALGRALGGFGAGVSALANKYIDEDLAKQRAQALADIQLATAGKMREQEDAFRNDPNRLERDRANRRADALSAGKTAREVEMEGLNDTGLQDKKLEVAGKTAEFNRGEKVKDVTALAPAEAAAEAGKAKARAQAESEIAKQFGNDPLFLKAQRNLAQAKHVESSDTAARAELVRMEIKDRKRLGELYDGLAALEADAGMKPEVKAAQAKAITTQIMAIKSKNGQGGSRDPELDTQTVVEKRMGADGSETTTTRKEVRRPGQGQQNSDPYANIAKALEDGRKPKEAPKAQEAPKTRGQMLRAEYEQALSDLEQMKSGTQTPSLNRHMVPQQEEKIRKLLEQIDAMSSARF